MGLFSKKCAYCGTKLAEGKIVERMGKKFCCEEHANKYWEYKKQAKGKRGGC